MTLRVDQNAKGFTGVGDANYLGIILSYGLLGYAWWSLISLLPSPFKNHRLRRVLLLFALANAVLAVGFIGYIRDFVPFGNGPFVPGWIITDIGFAVVAIGLWTASRSNARSSEGQQTDTMQLSVTEEPTMRSARLLLLTGFIVAALGTAITEWVFRGYTPWFQKGLFLNDTGVVLSLVLMGVAWWWGIPHLAIVPIGGTKRSLFLFSGAALILAFANLVLLFDLRDAQDKFGTVLGIVLIGIGYVMVAGGFWMVGWRAQRVLKPQVQGGTFEHCESAVPG